MDTIYVVSWLEHSQQLLDGFATNEAGVAQIIHNYWIKEECGVPGEFTIEVDLERKRVTVKEVGMSKMYYIITIERATP